MKSVCRRKIAALLSLWLLTQALGARPYISDSDDNQKQGTSTRASASELHADGGGMQKFSVLAGGHLAVDHSGHDRGGRHHDLQKHRHHHGTSHHSGAEHTEQAHVFKEARHHHGISSQEAFGSERLSLGQHLAALNETAAKTEQPATCGKEIFAREGDCPGTCPFAAESSVHTCHFKCVQKGECGGAGTTKDQTIPDPEEHICRRCKVEGCRTCKDTKPGEEEECEACMPGYVLGNGECHGMADAVFLGIGVAFVIATLIAIMWYVALASRPVVNEEPVKYGLECRTLTKFRQPSGEGGENDTGENNTGGNDIVRLFPLSTNLCRLNFMPVAGPGTVFFFQYQAAILIWGVILLGMWLIAGFVESTDLFILGTKPAETPQKMCAVVQWGRKRQMELIWVKIAWIAAAYLISFVGAMIFSRRQKRQFHDFDEANTTQCDFAALVTMMPSEGSSTSEVPAVTGEKKLEDLLTTCLQEGTGEPVVGVSVCWDFHHHEHEVRRALEADVGSTDASNGIDHATRGSLKSRKSLDILAAAAQSAAINDNEGGEAAAAATGQEPSTTTEQSGCGLVNWLNKITLKVWKVEVDSTPLLEAAGAHEEGSVKEILEHMKSTSSAFAVFKTKKALGRALEASQGKGGLDFSDGSVQMKLKLERATHEPESNLWEHFAISDAQVNMRLFKGCNVMLLSLALWTIVLYLPYAHYMGSFSYANHDEPGEMAEILFVCLVVLAQIGLFVAANQVSENAGYKYEDSKQRMYIILYNTALVLNVALDMALTATLSYHQMTGRGVRVADGRRLSELTTMQEIFESYPMQKSMGLLLKKYCWPATFFIPFFCEPFGVLWLPYHIGLKFIRTDKRMTAERAEKALELPIMEQGRYADLVFNAILVALVPFLAPGYMHILFGFFIFSHIWIYLSDAWKVLRCCTRFYFAGHETSVFGQKLFALPCGILLAALVFKANQMSGKDGLGSGVLKGYAFWGAVVGAFFGHMLLHVMLIDMINQEDHKGEEEDGEYADSATEKAATWFSCNPVHCLRSKYIYEHQPPQGFFVAGKEHLMQANPDIGSHYQGRKPQVPEDLLGI
jgi:hypothetical protein